MRLFSFEIWFLLAVSSVRLTGKKDMQLGKSYVKAWPEFWVQSVEGWVNLVEAMFDVLNGALKS